MNSTLVDMPKKPQKTPTSPSGEAKKQYPSRKKVKYVGIPTQYWELLKGMTEDGGDHEGRSMAYLVKIAIRRMLHGSGKVDDKGKPVQPPGE
jgi:hypothetical protein